jgi:DNA-binding NtrC family response regulator
MGTPHATCPVEAAMNVVIVDDDKRLLLSLTQRFSEAGHDVVAFEAFEAAKRYLSKNKPDVLVTDIRLGAFNGLQLVFLAKFASPQMTACVLSGFEDRVLRKDAVSAGASFHMKPIESEYLLHEIENSRRAVSV